MHQISSSSAKIILKRTRKRSGNLAPETYKHVALGIYQEYSRDMVVIKFLDPSHICRKQEHETFQKYFKTCFKNKSLVDFNLLFPLFSRMIQKQKKIKKE